MIKKYIENQAEEEGSFKIGDLEPKEETKKTLGGLIGKLLAGLSLKSRLIKIIS